MVIFFAIHAAQSNLSKTNHTSNRVHIIQYIKFSISSTLIFSLLFYEWKWMKYQFSQYIFIYLWICYTQRDKQTNKQKKHSIWNRKLQFPKFQFVWYIYFVSSIKLKSVYGNNFSVNHFQKTTILIQYREFVYLNFRNHFVERNRCAHKNSPQIYASQ